MRMILTVVVALSCVIFLSTTSARERELEPSARQSGRPVSAKQIPQDERELVSGAPVERELTGGEVHVYRIILAVDEYLHAVVDQRGIDVVVRLRGPDGTQLQEMEGIGGMLGAEELSWEAATAGRYTLEVRARAKQANTGRYELKVEKQREASAKDRVRIEAERLYMEGRRAQSEGSGDALERAVKKYQEAVEKWRYAEARKWEAQTLTNLGIACRGLSDYDKARNYYEQALVIWRDIKNRYGEGMTLNALGNVYEKLSQYEQARNHLEQALAIRREIKDRQGEGATLNNLGAVHESLSEYEKAREYYEQSLIITRELKSRLGEGIALSNLGEVYRDLSDYEKARDHYEQALAITREINDRPGEGVALNNLGAVYGSLGQNEKARDYYEQALAIRREIKDRYDEAMTLDNLGEVYHDLDQREKARNYYEQALAIRREIKDKQGEATTFNALGNLHRKLNQNEKARDNYEQALVITREIKDRQGEGVTLNNLGAVLTKLNQGEKGRDHLEQSLTIRREIGDSGGEASTLLSLASFERDRGNLSEARKRIESALAITETLRGKYTDQELRSAYFATAQNSYGFYIDLLMRLHKQYPGAGYDSVALQASERAHARSLLDTLAEAGANIRQGVDPQLLEDERSLHRQLNTKAQQQMKLLGGDHTREQAVATAREIETLTGVYQQLQAQIRRISPRYAALTQPQPLSVSEIQQQVLDADTGLLEYALGDEHSYVWVVTPTSISSFELPQRSEIERVARRAYELLKTSHRRESQRAAELAAADLSRMVLGPVAGQLGKKRLLIVSDGALQYVPFAALPVPDRDTEQGRPGDGATNARVSESLRRRVSLVPLVARHEIVSLPSASVLAVLRRELAGRAPAPKALAVLADPVFQGNDLRVRRAGMGNTPSPSQSPAIAHNLPDSDLTRSARESGVKDFERLRFTRNEAEAIFLQARDSDSLKALDFDAGRSTVANAGLDQYRIVHFATHGLLNSQHPELSGIVLSLVDEQGRPQDGFLRAHDVYNLRLRADLVVLSACQTALGKEIKGEGLAGMTRGFMYAGAARVVASLWDVRDEATAELMKRFYEGMLRKGLRPADALRAAQVSMWTEKRWRAPYYWAGFFLQGEWR